MFWSIEVVTTSPSFQQDVQINFAVPLSGRRGIKSFQSNIFSITYKNYRAKTQNL